MHQEAVMELKEERREGHVVIAIVGRLDSKSAGDLSRELSSTVQRGDINLVLDLTCLEYVSSIGLSVFLATAKRVRAQKGRLIFAGVNDRIRLVFEMSGLLQLLPIVPTVDAAFAK